MKTIINSQTSVGIFLGLTFEVVNDLIVFDDGSTFDGLSNGYEIIDVPQPSPPVDGAWSWNGLNWVIYDQSVIDNYYAQQIIDYNEMQSKKRHAAYIAESDPIFFKWQRQEATQQEWLDKIAEIDARFPYMT